MVVLSLWGFRWTTSTFVTNTQEAPEGRRDRWHPCQRYRHTRPWKHSVPILPQASPVLRWTSVLFCAAQSNSHKSRDMEPIRTIETVFWNCISFHCTDEKQKNWSRLYILLFHIVQWRRTGSKNSCQRSFSCHLLGNWKSKRRGELGDCEGNQGASVVTYETQEDR